MRSTNAARREGVWGLAVGSGDPPTRNLTPPSALIATQRASKLRVLFLCTGNSCRSQMAEGFARQLRGDRIEPYSAGVEPHGMNPRAVKAMAEAGVDISTQRSKHADELRGVPFDYVVTVCDHANEACPV